MKQHTKKVLAIILAFTLLAPSVFDGNVVGTKAADTQQEGSLADKVTGTWSYWDGSKDVVQTNAMLLDKLPTKANQGITRWTTEHYDESTGAFDMGEWGTSLMWSYTADKWEIRPMPFQCPIKRQHRAGMSQNHQPSGWKPPF